MSECRYSIGIDVGGTNTQIGLVDAGGRIQAKLTVPTRGHSDVPAFVDAVADSVASLVAKAGGISEVAGIGIGIPCANAATGCVEAATDLPWPSPIPIADMMAKATGLKVKISNDANAAAMGEYRYGAMRGTDNFIMLTLGTGVGAGVLCDGHLLSGSRGFAGELGHVRVRGAEDKMCSCGRKGCLQTVASAKGVVATALELMAASDRPSSLHKVPAESLTPALICRHADDGDPLALEVFEITGKVLGWACAEFAAFTDPDAIVLFGGIARASAHMLPALRRALEEKTLHLYKNRIQILTSRLPESDVAILGAASLPL